MAIKRLMEAHPSLPITVSALLDSIGTEQEREENYKEEVKKQQAEVCTMLFYFCHTPSAINRKENVNELLVSSFVMRS